jgi:hypothetical protein
MTSRDSEVTIGDCVSRCVAVFKKHAPRSEPRNQRAFPLHKIGAQRLLLPGGLER